MGDGESPAHAPRFPYRLGIHGTVWRFGLIRCSDAEVLSSVDGFGACQEMLHLEHWEPVRDKNKKQQGVYWKYTADSLSVTPGNFVVHNKNNRGHSLQHCATVDLICATQLLLCRIAEEKGNKNCLVLLTLQAMCIVKQDQSYQECCFV